MPNLIDIAQRLAERPMVALLHEERCLPERDRSVITCMKSSFYDSPSHVANFGT